MSKEQFKRKYMDSHEELHAISQLGYGQSLIKSSPGDKNIRTSGKIPGKNLIERKAMEKQSEKFLEFLLDASYVRGCEVLDSDKFAYKDLVNAVIKMMPQKIEQSGSVEFSFGDMVKKASLELDKIDDIDVEGESVED